MKTISIICPVYNSANFLPQLLESIKKQSYQRFECIFIDDHSKDDSVPIIEKVIDSRFKLIKNTENLGGQKSREIGFSQATGDYLVFIDSDDYLHHLYLEKMLDKLEQDHSDIVMCNYEVISEANKRLRVNNEVTPIDKSYFPLYAKDEKSVIMSKPAFWNKMFSVSFLKKYMAFPDVKVAQDLSIIPLLLSQAKISYVDEVLYSYRIKGQSVSNTYDTRILDIKQSFQYLRPLKDHFYNELEFMAIGHYYYQIAKSLSIQDKNLRLSIYRELKMNLGCEFPHYTKNPYYKKRWDYRIFIFFLKRKLFYSNFILHKLVIFILNKQLINQWIRKSDR